MSEENILTLTGLQQGIPMSEASICAAIGEKPSVVNRQIFDLVIAGKLERRCGVGSSPAMYFLHRQEDHRATA